MTSASMPRLALLSWLLPSAAGAEACQADSSDQQGECEEAGLAQIRRSFIKGRGAHSATSYAPEQSEHASLERRLEVPPAPDESTPCGRTGERCSSGDVCVGYYHSWGCVGSCGLNNACQSPVGSWDGCSTCKDRMEYVMDFKNDGLGWEEAKQLVGSEFPSASECGCFLSDPTPTPPPSPGPTPSTTPSPSPASTLEACLKGPGSSPHTYIGESEFELPPDQTSNGAPYTMSDVHNERLNAGIRPSAVVFATEEAHVIVAVSCAFEFGKPVYARSGMNQYEASCTDEVGGGAGCVLVDTNNMMDVGWPAEGCKGGAEGCVVPLGPGLSLGSAYAQLYARGYAIPAGTCAQVRVAGLTLGGGKGWITRKYGMLIDRLRAIDAVLLNGTKVHATDASDANLFWLARGGGGNIFPGVVTAFYFELVPIPATVANYFMTWPATPKCISSVFPQWYEKMAKNANLDLWARIEVHNYNDDPNQAGILISTVNIGPDKDLAQRLLQEVDGAAACGENGKLGGGANANWLAGIVCGANTQSPECSANPAETLTNGINCGWDLSGARPVRTACLGYDAEYNLQWYYRSLVLGEGGVIPQGVWDALAGQKFYNMFYIEFDPVNGAAATVPKNSTAYPHRDAGFIMMQQVIRGSASAVAGPVAESADMMKAMTALVPSRAYYNYLDKNMYPDYSSVPRTAYYAENADTVDAYLQEYTEGIESPNGCLRCDSWELRGETL